MKIAGATLFGLQLVLVGCDFDGFDDARLKEDFHYSYNLKPGGKLELESFNGSVEITGWDQDKVDISGTKYAPNKDLLDALKVDVVASADSIRVHTIRPMERRGNIGVKYIISVPRKTLLERIVSSNGSIRVQQLEGNARLKTSNGSIRATTFKGDLDVNTSNGSVELSEFTGGAVLHTTNGSIRAEGIRGFFDATTTNGSIDAHIAQPSTGRPVRAESTNGKVILSLDTLNTDVQASTSNSSITLKLPAALNARLKAHTSNSSISSDFDLAVKGTISKNRIDGTIGSGGPLVDLSTSNGSISNSEDVVLTINLATAPCGAAPGVDSSLIRADVSRTQAKSSDFGDTCTLAIKVDERDTPPADWVTS